MSYNRVQTPLRVILVLVGITYLFSGWVKLNDPMGLAFKLEDYFAPDVLDIPFLIPFTQWLSMVVILSELLLGISILFRPYRRIALRALFFLTLFFTFLTFYSAYYDKVTDCGCFGDAIPLTPWQSFTKDVILLILIAVLLWKYRTYPDTCRRTNVRLFLLLFMLINTLIGLMAVRYLPYIDFRPYKVGVNIKEASTVPIGAPVDEYEDIWRYKVNGIIREYNTAEEPWNIPNSEFVDRKSTLIKKGYQPPIHDFIITDENQSDITDSILAMNKVMIISLYDLDEAEIEDLNIVSRLVSKLTTAGIPSVGLSATSNDYITDMKYEADLNYPIYFVDKVPLKTMVRSNPGIVVLNQGTILAKYSIAGLPEAEEIQVLYQEQ